MNFVAHRDESSVLTSRVHWLRKAAGIFAASAGLAVLAGWMFDIQTLKSVLPGLITMKPLTATAFVLCGFALWAVQVPGDTHLAGARPPFVIAASAITVVIGLLPFLSIGFT